VSHFQLVYLCLCFSRFSHFSRACFFPI
jgi:hypothetical protein